MREPYNLSIAQIRGLTDYQILHIYCRPTKTSGKGGDGFLAPQERFIKVWQARGRAVIAEVMAKPPYNLAADALKSLTDLQLLKRKWAVDYPNKPWDEVSGG